MTYYFLSFWKALSDKTKIPLENFLQTFGLKVNIENTKAVWLGRERFSKDILLPQKNLAWVSNEPFDILGITFFAETPCTAEHNYKQKLVLDSWSWRLLSIIGKIQVIKSLSVSKFVHLFTTLPTPNEVFLKELETLFYFFICGGKGDKVARKIIINDVKDGGLKMTDIRSFLKALKIS